MTFIHLRGGDRDGDVSEAHHGVLPTGIMIDRPSGFQHYVPTREFYDVHAGRVHYYDFQGHIDPATHEPCQPWALEQIGPREALPRLTPAERAALRGEALRGRAARDSGRTDQG